MSSVIAETIEIIKEKSPTSLKEVRIDDLVLGIFFTGVKLSTGQGGCAFTPVGEIPEAVCCPTSAARMPQAGGLEGRTVSEILDYAIDPNVLKSAIGVAILNALTQLIIESERDNEYQITKDEDGFDLLKVEPHETVSLIGAFGPYIRRLKIMGNPFFVIEKNPQTLRPDEIKHFKPESEMRSAFEKSKVLIITGTAIVNHTIDSILSLIKNDIRTAIIGPTASMIPDAFFKRGVNIMAGVKITDSDRMIKILKQGGSAYHLLKECSEKIAFIKN
ncbi:MAG: Rossmann-like domain-containing protein [Thermodesulfobacteriota bacterium]